MGEPSFLTKLWYEYLPGIIFPWLTLIVGVSVVWLLVFGEQEPTRQEIVEAEILEFSVCASKEDILKCYNECSTEECYNYATSYNERIQNEFEEVWNPS